MRDEVFRVWWLRLLLFVTFGFGAACMLPWVGYFWPLALLALPLGYLAVRGAMSGVQLTSDDVIVRGVFRTRRAGWNEVDRVRETAGSSTGLPWRVPEFVLRDGSIKAQEVRTLRRENSVVDDVIEASRQLLQGRPGRT